MAKQGVHIIDKIQNMRDFQGPTVDGYVVAWNETSGKFVMSPESGGSPDLSLAVLLAGRSTPQQINLGTLAGASTGYLSSTAHATKGSYGLTADLAIIVDEANSRLISPTFRGNTIDTANGDLTLSPASLTTHFPGAFWKLAPYGFSTYGGLYSDQVTPSGTNYTLITEGTTAFLNGTAAVYIRNNNNNRAQFASSDAHIYCDLSITNLGDVTKNVKVAVDSSGNATLTPSGGIVTVTGMLVASGSVSCSGTSIDVNGLLVPSSAFMYWSSRSVINSPADGNIRLTNNAQTGFGLLQLGGTTSSFPAIKRNGAGIDIRAADDSGYANVQANYFYGIGGNSTFNGVAIGVGNATVYANTSNIFEIAGNNFGDTLSKVNLRGSSGLMLGFGPNNSSSEPALKRNGAGIDFRLADDSGYANVSLGNLILSNGYNSLSYIECGGDGGRITAHGGGYQDWYFGSSSHPAGLCTIGFGGGSFSGMRLASQFLIGWNDTFLDATGMTPSVAFGYNSPGVVEVNNGTPGTFRDFKSRSLIVNPISGGDTFTLGSTSSDTFTFAINAVSTGVGILLRGDYGIAGKNFYASNGFYFNQNMGIGQYPSVGIDTGIVRASKNSLVFGTDTAAAGAATSRTEINKTVASIADNTFADVFTVTIPNAAHSATIRVRLSGSSGAGGSVGSNESTQDAEYHVNITRTANLNAVASIGSVTTQAAAVTVTGGNAVAVSGQLSSISGANNATNTFTIQVKVARTGGTATNHTCLAFAELLNANASGVAIS